MQLEHLLPSAQKAAALGELGHSVVQRLLPSAFKAALGKLDVMPMQMHFISAGPVMAQASNHAYHACLAIVHI